MRVNPIPNAPAATVTISGERALVIADYHAGIETAFRFDGLEIESREEERRSAVVDLITRTDADKVIFLGDLAHWIGEPYGAELDELQALIDAVTELVPAVLIKGNHDGKIEDAIDIPVSSSDGMVIDNVGFVHGHTHPSEEVVSADVLCIGHEHVTASIEDSVGGRRIERAWLRGTLAPGGFSHVDADEISGNIIVFPAFNELVGGTWVNMDNQEFLAPFLPEGIADGELYLLDGTRLGKYTTI